jgi:sugar phosphate isomerase/epimerase
MLGSAHVGLMLYTVRADCARDFEATLHAVAELGYEGVEIFDLHGHEPARAHAWLESCALTACGRHARLEAIETGLDDFAREADALGWRRLVVSWIDPAALSNPDLPGRLRRAAVAAAARGLELGFHNHADELRRLDSGRTFLDELPAELFLELDLGWAWYAGADVEALLRRSAGRCPLVHVKDFRHGGRPPAYCPVGDGAVGYETVVPAALAAGVEWLLVEQDEVDGSALDAAARSLAALESMVGEGA